MKIRPTHPVVIICIFGSALSVWSYINHKNQQRANIELRERIDTSRYITHPCQSLLLMASLEQLGENEKSKEIRDKMIFDYALQLDKITKKSDLSSSDKKANKGIIEMAARHYWQDTKRGDVILNDRFNQSKKQFLDMVERYKSAEQAAPSNR